MDNSRSLLRASFLFALCALASGNLGCSGSGGGLLNPPPVHAQSYSNSSLDGTYTISMSAGEDAALVSSITFLGSITFDGNGNITAGSITEAATPYGGSTATCSVSVTGTYSILNNATGTANLNLSGNIVSNSASSNSGAIGNGNNCWAVPPTLSLSLEAAQQGEVVAFQMASGSSGFNFAGTAYKQ